jgi:hypothetical protein
MGTMRPPASLRASVVAERQLGQPRLATGHLLPISESTDKKTIDSEHYLGPDVL